MHEFPWEISSSSELILLSLKKSPSYGAEISRRISAASDYCCFLTAGNLYPMLKRLKDQGFLESYLSNGLSLSKARRGRATKYYRITEKGLAALEQARLTRDQLDEDDDIPGTDLSPSTC